MRFHIHLLPTYFPGEDPPFDVYFQQILEQVQLADELGFECFWFTEHHFVLYGGPVPNPAVIMSAAAARTSRIHLGSAISILPLHHPVQIAEDYARTGMGRSFRAVRADALLPEFDGKVFRHAASEQYFTPYQKDGRYYLRRHQVGSDGSLANVLDSEVH